jgi:hypothetical protein
MILVKIIALLFGLIVISKTLTDFKKKEENWQMFLFWLIIWSSVIFIAFNPNIISQILTKLGNRSITVGQIVGIGFVFLLFVVYRIYIKANRIEHEFSRLIRRLALQNLKKRKQ